MSNNLLTKLPANLKQLVNLTQLSVGQNLLTALPPGIEDHLTKLETLELEDNRLETLPIRIGQLSQLRRLMCHNNRLGRVPAELAKLGHIREYSSEWFIYLSPPQPKILRDTKGMMIID